MQVCAQEKIDLSRRSLDTTSFSVTGNYTPPEAEPDDIATVHITHGYSKARRPDLKQIIQELIVTQDGGIPILCQLHDGNANDAQIFQTRAQKFIQQFQQDHSQSYLVADSKLYTKETAYLLNIPFITRIPQSLKLENTLVHEACHQPEKWEDSSKVGYRYQVVTHEHYGIKQRWVIYSSEAAQIRAEKKLNQAVDQEAKRLKKALFHLQAQRFDSKACAEKAFAAIQKTVRYHNLEISSWTEKAHYKAKGRPTKQTEADTMVYQIIGEFHQDTTNIAKQLAYQGCFTLGTNIDTLSADEVLSVYKKQSSVEQGYRFLKDPLFFTSSFFLKNHSRIIALVTVMTLALLVYSVAQRRLRQTMAQQQATLPNQIRKPTQNPTLRWIFQCLGGIHRVIMSSVDGQTQVLYEGICSLKRRIIQLFGPVVSQIYGIYVT